MNDQLPAAPTRSPGLWAYNIRILLGNSYWLIITPLAAAQLVLFWNMAIVSMSSPPRAAGTVEQVASILAAFLCAHALAPEQGKVGELVFVRPVSIERILILRIVAVFAFVLLAMSPVFVLLHVRTEAFALGTAVLAALPSMLFLSLLALGVSSAVRHPLLGFAVASVFWVVDLLTKGALNPLTSLQGYAGLLAGQEFSELWIVNKLVLLGASLILYLWIRSMLGRPAAPLRFRGVAARSVLALAIVFTYVVTGAGYRLAYGLARETEIGPRCDLWYRRQFGIYGPVPVSRLFGPAFPMYLKAASGTEETGEQTPRTGVAKADIARLRALQERYPDSVWADNAQLLIAVSTLAQEAAEPIVLVSYQADKRAPSVRVVGDDLDRGRAEFEALAEQYPESPFAPFAMAQLAAIGISELDLESAVSANRRLLERYPGSPEAGIAGVGLSAYHLSAGEPERALEAADVAAELAPWDVLPEALFAAARAAQTAGKLDVARDRYTRAREAAADAGERAVRGERSPSHLPKGHIFERVNGVYTDAERALDGDMEAAPAPPAGRTRVTGNVVVDAGGAEVVRVALGRAPDAGGLPSPFAQGPAAIARPERDGSFSFSAVSPVAYEVLAFALRVPKAEATRSPAASPISLPVEVAGTAVEIAPIRVDLERPEPEMHRPPAPEGTSAPPRGSARGGARGARGGRDGESGRGGGGGRGRESGRGGGAGRNGNSDHSRDASHSRDADHGRDSDGRGESRRGAGGTRGYR